MSCFPLWICFGAELARPSGLREPSLNPYRRELRHAATFLESTAPRQFTLPRRTGKEKCVAPFRRTPALQTILARVASSLRPDLHALPWFLRGPPPLP